MSKKVKRHGPGYYFQRLRGNPKTDGTEPSRYVPVLYGPADVRFTEQDHWSPHWPIQTTQYGARITDNWWGNQLPGETNFIPGLNMSQFVSANQLGYMNNTRYSVQYNAGLNTLSYSSFDNALLQKAVLQAWQNRAGY